MPSVAGQLAHARNQARVSPSFRETGEGNIAPPTGMMRPTTPETAAEEGGRYAPREFASGPARNAGGAVPAPRGTMGAPAGIGGLAATPELSAQLNPLQKPKAVIKVIRSLVPDKWMEWFSLNSWKDPVEIGLRLSVLKIAFWVGVFGLIIIAAMATIEALNPLS
ncbi:MAG: hypothetical protein AAB633_03170 [Patescibacteria group bacterium]